MKCKVRLSYTVEMFVEATSEEAVMDWLNSTTPAEAKELAKDRNQVYENFSEEIICNVREDSIVDYVIDRE